LQQKNYTFDKSFYGNVDEFCEKVALFFHRCLQGCEAAPAALPTLLAIASTVDAGAQAAGSCAARLGLAGGRQYVVA
jgi:hypothetical protein